MWFTAAIEQLLPVSKCVSILLQREIYLPRSLILELNEWFTGVKEDHLKESLWYKESKISQQETLPGVILIGL